MSMILLSIFAYYNVFSSYAAHVSTMSSTLLRCHLLFPKSFHASLWCCHDKIVLCDHQPPILLLWVSIWLQSVYAWGRLCASDRAMGLFLALASTHMSLQGTKAISPVLYVVLPYLAHDVDPLIPQPSIMLPHTGCLLLYSSWNCFIHPISWLDWSDVLRLWSSGQIGEPYFVLIDQSQDNDNSSLVFDDHANSFLSMILPVLFWHRRPYASASLSKLLFKAIVTRCFTISRFHFHASLWCSHDSTV